jgi:hypothetical protein
MTRVAVGVRAWLGLCVLLVGLLGPATAAADPLTGWTAGPDGVGDATYDGYIDVPAAGATVPTGNFSVSGWFVDKTAEGWAGADQVQLYAGQMGNGGIMLAAGVVGQNRPDVATAEGNPAWAASGFSGVVPAGSLQPGSQTLSAYVHTPGKGWWYRSVNVTVSTSAATAANPATAASAPHAAPPIIMVEVPTASQDIKQQFLFEVIGLAVDTSAGPAQGAQGSGIDRVELYLDGARGEAGSISIGQATLGYSDQMAASTYGPQFAYSGWRLAFNPTNFHAGVHTIWAYARSAVTGQEALQTVGFNDTVT